MNKAAKAWRKLLARQSEYDDMVKKRPELKEAYHRPGSIKLKG